MKQQNTKEALTEWANKLLSNSEMPKDKHDNFLKIANDEIANGGLRGNVSEKLVARFGHLYLVEKNVNDLYL